MCRQGFSLSGSSLICPSRHTYDIARQGYVNLLGRPAPVNADTADMVAARDRFLSSGHYRPITDDVAAALPEAHRLVEVGAGTGHHLAGVLKQLPKAHGLAVDVSVPASRRAARAHPRMASVVADTWDSLPLADASVDAVLCIFAPRNLAEFARVLSGRGTLVVVLPHSDHLSELRHSHGLLEVGEAKLEKLKHAAHGHFDIVSTATIAHDIELTEPQATDLVAMGPNAFHNSTASIPATQTHVSVACITMAPTSQVTGYAPGNGHR